MLEIQKKIIRFNYNIGRSGQAIKYIVVHDTGNPKIGANALSHFNYFNDADRQASAHYFVDDNSIIQTVEDLNTSWHCGDGYGQYGITNQNSLGLEICINSDGDYNRAVLNTIDLTKYLMEKYNVILSYVVRHYDASRKICPGSMSKDAWKKWYEFKAKLLDKLIYVQVGAFSIEKNADEMIKKLEQAGFNAFKKY